MGGGHCPALTPLLYTFLNSSEYWGTIKLVFKKLDDEMFKLN